MGEVGVDAVKMERVCLRDGSENDGDAVGLEGDGGRVGEVSRVSNGGKSANEEREGTGASKEEVTRDNDETGEDDGKGLWVVSTEVRQGEEAASICTSANERVGEASRARDGDREA